MAKEQVLLLISSLSAPLSPSLLPPCLDCCHCCCLCCPVLSRLFFSVLSLVAFSLWLCLPARLPSARALWSLSLLPRYHPAPLQRPLHCLGGCSVSRQDLLMKQGVSAPAACASTRCCPCICMIAAFGCFCFLSRSPKFFLARDHSCCPPAWRVLLLLTSLSLLGSVGRVFLVSHGQDGVWSCPCDTVTTRPRREKLASNKRNAALGGVEPP